MLTSSERILARSGAGAMRPHPLHGVAATRALEAVGVTSSAGDSLMQLAGRAVAELALAVAPHARSYWVACGPGNNGGDGLVAAAILRKWGKQAVVSQVPGLERHGDAGQAWQRAMEAGVPLQTEPPAQFDAVIDALFGIGTSRSPQAPYVAWLQHIQQVGKPVIAVDVPSGLNADTGTAQPWCVRADHTLSLLTLKPGLFTAAGRDHCGDIWFHNLGVEAADCAVGSINPPPPVTQRLHNTHKGSYGDVFVVGGAPGMTGAALLAARAALHAGAGRVYVSLLDPHAPAWSGVQPELMFRNVHTLDLSQTVVVAGCGGGDAIADVLPLLMQKSGKLVLDADALNQIANSRVLQEDLLRRAPGSTVMTPHPLEAARLLQTQSAAIQGDRLGAARALAEKFQCVAVLKGSGTIIAAPGTLPCINTTGNAQLATAGSGDVLAGMVAAGLAAGADAWTAACHAVYHHGNAVDPDPSKALTASGLTLRI